MNCLTQMAQSVENRQPYSGSNFSAALISPRFLGYQIHVLEAQILVFLGNFKNETKVGFHKFVDGFLSPAWTRFPNSIS